MADFQSGGACEVAYGQRAPNLAIPQTWRSRRRAGKLAHFGRSVQVPGGVVNSEPPKFVKSRAADGGCVVPPRLEPPPNPW